MHHDLSKESTQAQAEDAIVYGRDKAVLRRSDFLLAQQALAAINKETP